MTASRNIIIYQKPYWGKSLRKESRETVSDDDDGDDDGFIVKVIFKKKTILQNPVIFFSGCT